MKREHNSNEIKKNQLLKIVQIILTNLIIFSAISTLYYGFKILETKHKTENSIIIAEEMAKNNNYPIKPYKSGDIIGLIESAEIDLKTALIFGGTAGNEKEIDEAMKKGAALDSKSPSFIENKQSIIYGHRNQEFMRLEKVKVGTKFKINTNDGTFTFVTTSTKIVNEKNNEDVDLYKYSDDNMPIYEKGQLILYTCYPFNIYASNSERFLVFTKMEGKNEN